MTVLKLTWLAGAIVSLMLVVAGLCWVHVVQPESLVGLASLLLVLGGGGAIGICVSMAGRSEAYPGCEQAELEMSLASAEAAAVTRTH